MVSKTRKIALVTAIALTVTGCLAGCGSKQCTGSDGADKLTYWMSLDPGTAMTVTNYGETPFAQEWQKRTGVEVEFIHPPVGQASEKFSIMTASGELTDIIEYSWNNYSGGADRAIKDGLIISLNEKLEKNSPAFYKYMQENPDVAKEAKTDEGMYIGYPGVMEDESLGVSAGLYLRKDWLDELSLPVPETIDEWETTLIAFRDKKHAKAPLSILSSAFTWNLFVSSYDTGFSMYVDEGVVKFGPFESGFKEFLTKMNHWYNEGLLDSNLASVDDETIMANVLNGVTGATAGALGSGIGKLLAAAPDEKFDLVAAPYTVKEKGTKSRFGRVLPRIQSDVIAISQKCKDIDKAMKFLDYGYTEEGRMLFNFGIEGESYTMVDGYPTYTEDITNNKEGLPMQAMLLRYSRAANGATGSIQDKRYLEQYAGLPQQQNAWKVWSDNEASSTTLPPFSSTAEETENYAKLLTEIDSYNSEMILKFIMGLEPISGYEAYVDELKHRGIDDLIKIHQNAYERFINR